MADIRAFTAAAITSIRAARPHAELRELLASMAREQIGEVLGDCPLCGAAVGSVRRGWRCKQCALFIPAEVARRKVSTRMASQLLKHRQTRPVKGFRSRAGKTFDAALKLDDSGKVVFHFPDPDPLGPCPICEKPVRRRGKVYTCDSGRACAFVLFVEQHGHSIPEQAVRSVLESGQSGPLEGFTDQDGQPWSGLLVKEGSRILIRRYDARESAGGVGPCPRCRGEVRFQRGRWRCTACAFSLPDAIARRELRPEDIQALLATGRTPRLHGFRQSGGAVFKAALVMGEDHKLSFDYRKPPDEAPPTVPPGGPAPAFGQPVTCPLCRDRADPEPGYVIAGRRAWGCSRWRQGCPLQIPFIMDGLLLPEDEVLRLLGRHRATRYLSGFGGRESRTHRKRVVLDATQPTGWILELQTRRGKK